MKKLGIRRAVKEFAARCPKTRKMIPLNFGIAVVLGVVEASPPAVLGTVIDQLLNHKATFLSSPLFLVFVLALFGLFCALSYGMYYYREVIAETANATFQLDLYRHLQKLSADFYQRTRVGEITSRLTNDMNRGIKPLYKLATEFPHIFAMLAMSICFLALSNRVLLSLFVGLSLIYLVVGRVLVPRIERRFRNLQDQYGSLNAKIVENVNAHSLIRAFAREKQIEHETKSLILSLRDRQFNAERFMQGFNVFVITFHLIVAPFVLLLCGSLLAKKSMTIGALAAALSYWGMISYMLHVLLENITSIYVAFAGYGRVLEFFDETPLVRDRAGAPSLAVTAGAIRLEGVRFQYPVRNDSFAIETVTLPIPAQARTALVGRSGSGKSTLAQLLMRVYDVTGGRILVDGQDIASVTQHSLRSHIGFVMQETMLLDGTIRSNMSFVKQTATEKEIISALERAQLWHFISESSQGLDTVIGEKGVRLSGGQRQRLAIARVFLLDPPMVILDEATSSLDAMTERAIMQTVKKLTEARTALIITHRLSTVIDADQIVLLDRGGVSGVGTHAELVEKSALYRTMCEQQHLEARV
jgi:ABC-type multidrug transport system fused ATPase/permease subunit